MAKLIPAAKTAAASTPAAPAAKKVAGKPAAGAALNSPAVKAALKPAKPASAEPAEESVPLTKMRGPRGVAETAVITVLVEANPKRPNTKAHAKFECYTQGMTVGEFCDAVDANEEIKGGATSNLVYDAQHGLISIEGYEPGEPKARKGKKAAAEDAGDGAAEATA